MGGRCAGHETDEEGNLQDVNLDNLDWNKLGNIAAKSFHRTTGLEFMLVNCDKVHSMIKSR